MQLGVSYANRLAGGTIGQYVPKPSACLKTHGFWNEPRHHECGASPRISSNVPPRRTPPPKSANRFWHLFHIRPNGHLGLIREMKDELSTSQATEYPHLKRSRVPLSAAPVASKSLDQPPDSQRLQSIVRRPLATVSPDHRTPSHSEKSKPKGKSNSPPTHLPNEVLHQTLQLGCSSLNLALNGGQGGMLCLSMFKTSLIHPVIYQNERQVYSHKDLKVPRS